MANANPKDPADADANLIAQANTGNALMETNSGNVVVTPNGGNSSQATTLTPSQISAEAANQQLINQGNAQVAATNQTLAVDKEMLAQEQADAPGTPISVNLNALQAQANSQAQNSVNPLYTQYLNQYMQTL